MMIRCCHYVHSSSLTTNVVGVAGCDDGGMATIRERVLAAAIDLVGARGVRSLTHVRVDAAAGLPKGSTSNHFRTRAALIAGVIDAIATAERDELAAGPGAAAASGGTPGQGAASGRPPRSASDPISAVVDVMAAALIDLTGPHAVRTRARLALFIELAAEPELRAPLEAQRHEYEVFTRGLLASLGADDPDAAVRTLMAALDGLILHRVTVDPDAPVHPTIDRVLRACLD